MTTSADRISVFLDAFLQVNAYWLRPARRSLCTAVVLIERISATFMKRGTPSRHVVVGNDFFFQARSLAKESGGPLCQVGPNH